MALWSTFRGKPFEYEGSISGGLVVFTLDDNEMPTGTRLLIDKETVTYVMDRIRQRGEVKMGACRDNPSRGSLGEFLLKEKKSPQLLSYVLPLLEKENLVSHYKRGRSYWVKYINNCAPNFTA